MATNLPSCFFIQVLEKLLKFLVNFTLLKYVKSQRSCGFLITKELIFGFQILDLKDHFPASLIAQKSLLRSKIKKVLCRAHVRSLEQRARNAHDQNEQTLIMFLFAHHNNVLIVFFYTCRSAQFVMNRRMRECILSGISSSQYRTNERNHIANRKFLCHSVQRLTQLRAFPETLARLACKQAEPSLCQCFHLAYDKR